MKFLIAWMTIGASLQFAQYLYCYTKRPEFCDRLLRYTFGREWKITTIAVTMILFGWPFVVWLLLSGSKTAASVGEKFAGIIRREIIDGPKWKSVLTDPPPRVTHFETARVRAFSWGPSPVGATCGNPTEVGIAKVMSLDGCTDFEVCGKPAVVSTTTIFENASDFEMDYCEEHRPPKTREESTT